MYNGVNAEYVLDRMEMYEVKILMASSHLKNKDNWEQARLIAYITAQMNSTKKLEITDIVTFPWDDRKEPPKVTEDDAERLQKKAEYYANLI